VTKSGDGPWDDATSHDDSPPESERMEGDDPPTTRASLADQVRMRAASRAPVPRPTASSTLPPPTTPERLPARGVHDQITPVALPAVTEAALRASRESTEPATTRTPRESAPPPPTPTPTSTSVAIVATGTDADHVRKLCQSHGLAIPIVASPSVAADGASIVVIGEPSLPVPPGVAHVARPALPDDALLDLLRSIVAGRPAADPPLDAADADPRIQALVDHIDASMDRAALELATREAITTLAQADRARVLFYDPATRVLWSEARRRAATSGGTSTSSTNEQRGAVGIVGFVAQTGRAVHASPAGDDVRYMTELDDPEGKAQTRLLVQPVLGSDRRTHAVLVAIRRWRHADFSDADRTTMSTLAARIAPIVDHLVAGRPRTKSASRPPPVTARRADSKPPPIIGTPAAGARVVATTPAAGASVVASPPSSTATTGGATGATPGANDSVPPRGPNDSVPPRTHAPSDPPGTTSRPPRKTTDVTDPLDVAILATAEEDIARVRKIAKKARLEVSVLARADEAPPYYRIVTLGEAWTPDTDRRVAYAARSTMTDDMLAELLVGLAHDRAPAPLVATKPQSPAEAKRVQQAFAVSRGIATASDLAEAEMLAITALRELLDADRAYCFYFNHEDGTLWSEQRRRSRGDDRRAIAGVVGWAARTGRATTIPRASADPRWLGPLDDPDGDAHSQLAVQPILAVDRRVIGVFIAARRTKRAPFTDVDTNVLERFAALAGPMIEQLQLVSATNTLLRGGTDSDLSHVTDSPIQALIRRARALPRWTFALGGAALMLLLVLAARC